MTDPCEDVKVPRRISRLAAWIDCHPRTGWYLAFVGTINVLLTFATLIVSALA